MDYTKISAETVNKNRSLWAITMSIVVARRMAKEFRHSIFRLPNGAYVVRVPTMRRSTPAVRRRLKASGQSDWR